MPDVNVRELGTLEDDYGRRMPVGVDYGRVTIGQYCLTRAQSLEFGRLFFSAYEAAADYAAVPADLDGWLLPPARGRHARVLCSAEPASGC